MIEPTPIRAKFIPRIPTYVASAAARGIDHRQFLNEALHPALGIMGGKKVLY
jgi:hypothetical protein